MITLIFHRNNEVIPFLFGCMRPVREFERYMYALGYQLLTMEKGVVKLDLSAEQQLRKNVLLKDFYQH